MLLFLIITHVFSCRKKSVCEHQNVQLNLESPYNNWYSNLSSNNVDGNYFSIISNSGLTDAFRYEKHSGYISDFHVRDFFQNDDPCTTWEFAYIYLTYYSNIYKFLIDLRVLQMNDGVHLQINDYGSPKYGYIFMDYNITNNTESNIIYSENGKETSTYKISVDIINEITSNNITYYNVYKITNNLSLNEGSSFDITIIYIDKDNGMIKFEQKNGTIWDIAV